MTWGEIFIGICIIVASVIVGSSLDAGLSNIARAISKDRRP